MKTFNIYLSGVGGQGIGLLSETILRAADHAGHTVKAVDTHGLAQRGGIVVSQIRMGSAVYSPLIPMHQADLVVSLEKHEALRATARLAKEESTLIYYNTVWQPLDVRLGRFPQVSTADIQSLCQKRSVRIIEVFHPDLEEARMQNVALLAGIDREGLIPQIESRHYRQAMEDLMAGNMLKKNLALYESQRSAAK
jgi:indolepyruvate ferredoxin oxidoreductase beta subunit